MHAILYYILVSTLWPFNSYDNFGPCLKANQIQYTGIWAFKTEIYRTYIKSNSDNNAILELSNISLENYSSRKQLMDDGNPCMSMMSTPSL